MSTTTEDRLNELLDIRDARLQEAREEIRELEAKLDQAADGWTRHDVIDDDEALPLPRLELVYEQNDGWLEYTVLYRMVMKHFLGHVVSIPLGFTTCCSSKGNEPSGLPNRDGAHGWHDSAHLGLPLFKLMPGETAMLMHPHDYETFRKKGYEHRRTNGW